MILKEFIFNELKHVMSLIRALKVEIKLTCSWKYLKEVNKLDLKLPLSKPDFRHLSEKLKLFQCNLESSSRIRNPEIDIFQAIGSVSSE